MPTITIAVPDISCGHCVASITQALREQHPQLRATVNLAAKTVTLAEGSPASAVPAVLATLEATGYPAHVVQGG